MPDIKLPCVRISRQFFKTLVERNCRVVLGLSAESVVLRLLARRSDFLRIASITGRLTSVICTEKRCRKTYIQISTSLSLVCCQRLTISPKLTFTVLCISILFQRLLAMQHRLQCGDLVSEESGTELLCPAEIIGAVLSRHLWNELIKFSILNKLVYLNIILTKHL